MEHGSLEYTGAHPALTADPGGQDASSKLTSLLSGLDGGDFDVAIRAMEKRRKQLVWERMPERVILLRHGESEGNVNSHVYTSKGDSLLELTSTGMMQAEEAGARLKHLVGDGRIFVAVSPFERTQQTLYGLYRGGFPRGQVGVVHVDPRIREQEFGNFQNPGLTATARAEEAIVGRFYYRRPNAESSADVFDRISAFWDSLLSDGHTSLILGRKHRYDTALLVTHGLTIRLLLMAVFQWSVMTFETVFNIGNCHHITLRKNSETLSYDLCIEESFPPESPWATRHVWIRLKSSNAKPSTLAKLQKLQEFRDSEQGREISTLMASAEGQGPNKKSRHLPSKTEDADECHETWEDLQRAIYALEESVLKECSKPFTVVDYLTIKAPRTMQKDEVVHRLVPGHNLRKTRSEMLALAEQTVVPLDDVASIDWWGTTVSYRGKLIHMTMDDAKLTASDLDLTAGGRTSTIIGDPSLCVHVDGSSGARYDGGGASGAGGSGGSANGDVAM